jgi:hypothetical protein
MRRWPCTRGPSANDATLDSIRIRPYRPLKSSLLNLKPADAHNSDGEHSEDGSASTESESSSPLPRIDLDSILCFRLLCVFPTQLPKRINSTNEFTCTRATQRRRSDRRARRHRRRRRCRPTPTSSPSPRLVDARCRVDCVSRRGALISCLLPQFDILTRVTNRL